MSSPKTPSQVEGLQPAGEAFLRAMEAVAEIAHVASQYVETLDDVDSGVAAEAAKYVPGAPEHERKAIAGKFRVTSSALRRSLAEAEEKGGAKPSAEQVVRIATEHFVELRK